MLADEIKGEEEYNEELRSKKANIEDAPFDVKGEMGFQGQNDDKSDFNFSKT